MCATGHARMVTYSMLPSMLPWELLLGEKSERARTTGWITKLRTRFNFISLLADLSARCLVCGCRLIRGRSHMTSSLRGGGGFQMMTIDDEGGGGFGQ